MSKRKLLEYGGVAAGVVMIAIGVVSLVLAIDGRNEVRSSLKQEAIVGSPDMTPDAIDWRRWLGVDEGLCADVPFDRAIFRQWRAYWPYGAGMMTDLFVHRLTAMLKATGLRYPARVAASGSGAQRTPGAHLALGSICAMKAATAAV